MTVNSFEELIKHKGHKIVCVTYNKDDKAVNVSIECEICNEVILDFDK